VLPLQSTSLPATARTDQPEFMGCSNTKAANTNVSLSKSDVQLSCGKEADADNIKVVQQEKFAVAIECPALVPKSDDHAMAVSSVYENVSSLCVKRAIASALLSTRAGLPDDFYAGFGMSKIGPVLWTPTCNSTSSSASTDEMLSQKGKSQTVVPSSPLTAETRASPLAMPTQVPSSPTAAPDNAAARTGLSSPTTQSSFAAATSLPPPSLPKALLDEPDDMAKGTLNAAPLAGKVTTDQRAVAPNPSRKPKDAPNDDDAQSPPPKVEPTASTEWIEAHLRLANMHPGGQRPASGKKGKKKKSVRQSGSSGNLSPRGGSVTISLAGGSGGRSLK